MRVLVLKEKHGDDYFAVPADKEGVVMLHVIKERYKRGWYGGVVDEVELKLLDSCINEDDFTSAIKFFKLRRNGEYEGWDLVDAHILPGAQYAYSPLPMGCRDRYNQIGVWANELLDNWTNGNRKDVLAKFEEMDTKSALAVLAHMMMEDPASREGLRRWLMEVA